jgi:methionyl-tRNA formyltransferase
MTKSQNFVFFGNNFVGREVLSWLIREGYVPILVVMHRPEASYYFDDIKTLAYEANVEVLYHDQVHKLEGVERIREVEPDVGISAYYGYILKPEILDLFKNGIINMHGAYLPWCRGRNPNVWTIIDQAPAGVTLHLMCPSTDTGPILGQRKVDLTPDMTAKDLYRKMEQASLDLFFDTFPEYLAGEISPQPQPKDKGTFHLGAELPDLKKLDLDEEMSVGRTIDILRACTFPPFAGARFVVNGVEYEVNIQIKQVLPNE